jgi:periplasmic protein TonB
VEQEPQKPDPTPSKDPPPSQQLGLDTEGAAGGDAFGLVGNKGGRDITAAGGSAFAWYAGLLKDAILDQLNEDRKVRSGNYRVTVRAWVRTDGSVDRMEIVRGSGDATRDRAIESDLEHVKRLPQARPTGMPDVISFEVVARG